LTQNVYEIWMPTSSDATAVFQLAQQVGSDDDSVTLAYLAQVVLSPGNPDFALYPNAIIVRRDGTTGDRSIVVLSP
jgi:hypothetical protein